MLKTFWGEVKQGKIELLELSLSFQDILIDSETRFLGETGFLNRNRTLAQIMQGQLVRLLLYTADLGHIR